MRKTKQKVAPHVKIVCYVRHKTLYQMPAENPHVYFNQTKKKNVY